MKTKLWTKDFVCIIVINFLVFMNHIMILSTFPLFLERELGQGEGFAGGVILAFSVVSVLFRMGFGHLLNQGRRRLFLVIGLAGMLLMPIGYIFSIVILGVGLAATAAIVLTVVCRMLHGISLAIANTTTATVASDSLPETRFAEGMGYFGMATALGTACAPALGLTLMNISFRLLFAAASVFILISLIILMKMNIREIVITEKQPFRLKGLLEKTAIPASVICLVSFMTWGALENFLSEYAIKYDLPSGGLFFAITAVMLIVTRVTIGRQADRFGEGIFVYTCNISMFIAYMLLAFSPGLATFIAAAVLAGYAFGGVEPVLQSMAIHIAPPERRGSANSTFLCAYDVGIGGGGAIAGFLISGFGYHNMFLIQSCAAIVSILLYVFWGRNHPSSFSWQKRHKLHGAVEK
ncbi:MAG: MFS transporter [Clostridiales bacterium]|nr:MFS transporter [Clostridiales bacterium]